MIEFKSKEVVSTILDPADNFSTKKEKIEIRFDPLTGQTGRLAHLGMYRPLKEEFSAMDTPEIRRHCPFCPPNLEMRGAKYPPELIPRGIITRGQATVIPNIAPYDKYNPLTVMSHDHLVLMEDLTFSLLKDAFSAGIEFCRLVAEKDPDIPYYHMAWNYMPPSGGSLVHPHQQAIITCHPGNLYSRVLEGSRSYHEKYGKNYWEDLCSTEKERGERFVSEPGKGVWLVSFVPLGILGEFMVVFPGIKTIFDLDESGVDDFVRGLQCLFQYFMDMGIYSFNLGLYSAPRNEKEDNFCLHARIIPRTFLNLQQRPPDTNILYMVFHEPYAVISPEKHCQDLKPFFNQKDSLKLKIRVADLHD